MAKMLFSEEKFVDICLNISRRMEKLRFSSDKMDRILCSDYILRSCYTLEQEVTEKQVFIVIG
jgi:hypothetical protein